MDGLSEPLEPGTQVLLRRAVRDHAATESRRSFSPTVHVGVPGERVAALVLDPAQPTDPGLRTDVVAALRVRARATSEASSRIRSEPLVWLTRSGEVGLVEDVDVRWLAAARAAYAEAGAALTFVVVTRHGWCDPRSGLTQRWKRVRSR